MKFKLNKRRRLRVKKMSIIQAVAGLGEREQRRISRSREKERR